MASVELVQVAKRYGKQSVLHPLDLTIPDGSFTVLVGPSGCGKSTLLRLLAGLDTVSDGAIMLDKKQINDLDPADRDIAMVFQSYALYPHLTVAENLAFHMQVKKVKREEQKSKIARIAGILGIDQLLQRYPRALSGGQRQRVAMGSAWRWAAPWCAIRRCFCLMSRFLILMRSYAWSCGPRLSRCISVSKPLWSMLPMIRLRR